MHTSQDSAGLRKLSCIIDMCYAQVQQVQMGSKVFNIRNIPVKSQDQVIAVAEKGINVFMAFTSSAYSWSVQ